jgi:hypothetical protein
LLPLHFAPLLGRCRARSRRRELRRLPMAGPTRLGEGKRGAFLLRSICPFNRQQ